MGAPIQRNEKGILSGVITRKDALVRYDIVAARVQRNEGAEKNRQSMRNGVAKHSTGRYSQ